MAHSHQLERYVSLRSIRFTHNSESDVPFVFSLTTKPPPTLQYASIRCSMVFLSTYNMPKVLVGSQQFPIFTKH